MAAAAEAGTASGSDPGAVVEALGGREVRVALVEGLQERGGAPAEGLRGRLERRELPAGLAAACAATVPSLLALRAAAARAHRAQGRPGGMATRTTGTELLFRLSGGKHISAALERFGLRRDSAAAVLAAFADEVPAAEFAAVVGAAVAQGARVGQLADLGAPRLVDARRIQKFYKLSADEMAGGPRAVEDGILAKLALQDFEK